MCNSNFRFQGAVLLLLYAVSGLASAAGTRNDCPALLPAGAVSTSEPWLCRLGGADSDNIAVCRDYRHGQKNYRLVFNGGTKPVGLQVAAASELATVIDDPESVKSVPRDGHCDPARPAEVPVAARYLGTGVCEDAGNELLPCSLYEHAGARTPEMMRYFVYYEPDGRGLRRVESMSAGANSRVLEAELAYQLGQSLSARGCCTDHARGYAAHAVALFPGDAIYRDALRTPAASAPRAAADPGCIPNTATSLTPID